MLELDMWAKSKSVLVPFFGSMPENNAWKEQVPELPFLRTNVHIAMGILGSIWRSCRTFQTPVQSAVAEWPHCRKTNRSAFSKRDL
jgi:hypothetical protein